MKPGFKRQSQLKAVRPKTIVSTRTTTIIGKWDSKPMYEIRKTSKLAAEMSKLHMTIP
ncbi:hypothetical protein DPMN_081663 [Dreissena polymorpha]|uniref:Uncharacterized protein n=1 Tax=Dreissena polymorpha TaxID=45954 RepID=A0A9D4BI01_DREPO|nr:hypothetical protein DPMN_081663 [Dreissena polymorpha]